MNILTKATVLVLNRNWQAINVRTPQEAFCMMASNVATGLEIEREVPTGAHIQHREDSPFLRTHEQAPEGIPV